MLQAVKPDNAPSQVKVRPGTGTDPADSAFAGLMAQASLASMTPAAATPEPAQREAGSPRDVAAQRTEPRETALQRPGSTEPEAVSKPRESGEAGKGSEEPGEAPGEAAKAAASQEAAASTSTLPSQAPPSVDATTGVPAGEPGPDSTSAQPLPPASNQPRAATGPQQEGASPASNPMPEAQTLIPADPTPSAKPSQGVPVRKEGPAVSGTIPAGPPPGDLPAGAVPSGSEGPRLAAGDAPKPIEDAKPVVDSSEALTDPQLAALKTPVPEIGRSLQSEPSAQQLQKASAPTLDAGQVILAEGAPRIASTVAHVAAPAPVRPSPFLNQVEGSIRWILQNKVQGAELQLHPESLGRMVISLRVEGQEVHARLWASEPTSLALLQDHKTFLQASLREQGLNLGSFDLQSGARGDGAQTAPQERSPLGTPVPFVEPKQELPTGPDLVSASPHRIEVFA